MRAVRVVPAFLLVVALFPWGSAGACAASSDPNAESVLDSWYVRVDATSTPKRVQLWDEENGLPGLQTRATMCDGRLVPADVRVLDLPATTPVLTL